METALFRNEGPVCQARQKFSIKNPATGVEIETYPLMNREDVDQMVATARAAFAAWSAISFAERRRVLTRAAEYLADNAGRYATEIAAENGKTKVDAMISEIGSMTMESQRQIVQAQLEDALSKGAKLAFPIQPRPDDKGLWFPPTLLLDGTPDMKVFQDETFGPLKIVMAYDTEDEAIQLANSVQYGLSGCVFTHDPGEGRRIAKWLKTGSVNINDVLLTYAIPSLPFGGIKKSGLGYYHGKMGIRAFTDVKSITENYIPLKRELYWYPMLGDTDKILEAAFKALFSGKTIQRVRGWITLLLKAPRILRSIM